jgi:hypothetical protein
MVVRPSRKRTRAARSGTTPILPVQVPPLPNGLCVPLQFRGVAIGRRLLPRSLALALTPPPVTIERRWVADNRRRSPCNFT